MLTAAQRYRIREIDAALAVASSAVARLDLARWDASLMRHLARAIDGWPADEVRAMYNRFPVWDIDHPFGEEYA